jgi:hypothetical protein
MKHFGILATLSLILLGVASAFFRPAAPYQVPSSPSLVTDSFNHDVLDNPSIEEDSNIKPAGKCGFCIG